MKSIFLGGDTMFNVYKGDTLEALIKEADIERDFFTTLVKMGVHVKIESNRE